ncbi:MAG: hypothetical protein RJA86_1173 [Pseudomonadota bacterium]
MSAIRLSYIQAQELFFMHKLLLGVLLIASLLPTTVLYAASLSAVSLAAQQTVMTELAKLEKNNDSGKYIRSSKLQALKLIKDAIEKNPELAASLTSFVISQGVGVSATVTTACQAAAKSDQAAAITAAAIQAAPPALAAAITAAAISVSPKQAAAITTAAINAVLTQAPAITSAAVTAAPLQANAITKAALKAAGSTEVRRLIAVAASNAGVPVQVINNELKNITNKNGVYEVFQKDTSNTVNSTMTMGSNSEPTTTITNSSATTLTGSTTGATGSIGGGGSIACVKNGVTASCS